MEIKVAVEGVQRIVCGVTEKTTCQEVVVALAQALGRTGRYTLREKFKGYERNVTPEERLLESLEKYGQQAREVQLTLQHLGPSLGDGIIKPLVPLRRGEAWGKTRRGGGSGGGTGLHRQSLPPLSCLRLNSEPLPEELKRPKRKSLTLMEEAWSWLENLGRGGRQHLGRDKGKSKDDDKRDGSSDSAAARQSKTAPASGALQGRDKKEKNKKEDQTRMSCLGKRGKETHEYETVGPDHQSHKKHEGFSTPEQAERTQTHDGSFEAMRDEEAALRRLIIQQQACLRELDLKIDSSDEQIHLLELQEAERQNPVSNAPLSEEEEQLEFWLNELKAEEGYEKDLQRQFLQLKEKVAECKNKLEEYKDNLLCMDTADMRNFQPQQGIKLHSSDQTDQSDEAENTSGCTKSATEGKTADRPGGGSTERAVITTVEPKLPCVLVSANQITELQPSGPSELREWWSRWAQAQKPNQGSTPKVVHRSEITIHLGSTRV